MKLILFASIVVGIAACTADPNSVMIPTPDCSQPPSASVSPATSILHVGGTLRVTASMTPCAGLPPFPVFRWRSTDTLTASVGPATGIVRARRAGTATIIAFLVTAPEVGGAMSLLVAP